jgi:chromosome segregation ATPase
MLSPIAFLIEHRKAIVQQYRQHDSKPKKTWASLQKILPQLSECMRFNTFKQYMSVFAVVTNGLDKVIQERDEVIQSQDSLLNDLKITTQQKTQLEEQVDELEIRLDKVIQNRDEVIQSRENLLNDLKITTRQKTQLEEQVDELKTRLDKVIHTQALDAAVIHGLDKKPKRICGWNVQKSKDGYYRCYRKIAKRVHSVYIGKDLDLKKAQVRITKKENALGLS